MTDSSQEKNAEFMHMADKKQKIVTGRLKPELFTKARVKMGATGDTWQGLIEKCVVDFVEEQQQSSVAPGQKKDRKLLIEEMLEMIEDGGDAFAKDVLQLLSGMPKGLRRSSVAVLQQLSALPPQAAESITHGIAQLLAFDPQKEARAKRGAGR